jgi:hypothetical protein
MEVMVSDIAVSDTGCWTEPERCRSGDHPIAAAVKRTPAATS